MEQFKTLVWTPFHKKHKFIFTEKHKTYLGEIIFYKCTKCGDIKVKISKRAT